MTTARYDVAQMCLNGHMVTDHAQTRREFSKNFCPVCGAETITHCRHCNAAIQGAIHSTSWAGGSDFLNVPPTQRTKTTRGVVHAYCHACGKPYPWTSASIEAAKALAQEMDELTDTEKLSLQASIDDLVADTPRTSVAVVRFKKLMPKVGKQGADGLKTILINVITEGAKRLLWPTP